MPHIPSSPTADIFLPSFDKEYSDAIKARNDVDKLLQVPKSYLDYRYMLGTHTHKNSPLIIIGVNPSEAKPDKPDPTIKRVEGFARNKKYDSFMMLNLYAQRATYLNDLEERFNEDLHNRNLDAFEHVLKHWHGEANPTIWAAWGTGIKKRDYLLKCLADIVKIGDKYDAEWVCAGRTKLGHPRHPSRLAYKTELVPFDVKNYLTSFVSRSAKRSVQ